MFFSKSVKTLLIALVALTLAGFTYAYAAANTVPASKAGDGQAAVTGYTITNVHYNLNATDPTKVLSVTFDLGAAASSVKIRLVSLGTTWIDCTTSGTIATCTPTVATQPTVLSVDILQVVATN